MNSSPDANGHVVGIAESNTTHPVAPTGVPPLSRGELGSPERAVSVSDGCSPSGKNRTNTKPRSVIIPSL